MKRSVSFLIFACLMLLALFCSEPNVVQPPAPPAVPALPTVITDSTTNISDTSVILHGEVNPNGIVTTCHFEYGLSTIYGYTTKEKNAGSGTSSVMAIDTVTGLFPGTIYYYRLVGASTAGKVNGTGLSFSTGLFPPTVTTDSATNVSSWSAVLNATVNPHAQLTSCFFEYGTTSSYGSTTSPSSIGSVLVPVHVSTPVNSLQPATSYHFRIVASNSAGTVRGTDLIFSTRQAPTVTTDSAGHVTGTGATLYGQVNPNGNATTYHFEYGLSENYGSSTNEKDAGSGTSPVVAMDIVTGLSPNTFYYYRLVGATSSGQVISSGLTFATGMVSQDFDVFPLGIGSRYGYAYQFKNINRDMGPTDGIIDSGYVECHILDSVRSTDSTRVWKVQESRHILHTSMTALMAPNPVYVSTWQDTTVMVDLVESLTRSHELKCGGLVWSFPLIVGYNGAKTIGIYRYAYEAKTVLWALWDPSGGAIYMQDTVSLEAPRGVTYFSCRWGGWAMSASYGYRLAVLLTCTAKGSTINQHDPGLFRATRFPRPVVRSSSSRGSAAGAPRH